MKNVANYVIIQYGKRCSILYFVSTLSCFHTDLFLLSTLIKPLYIYLLKISANIMSSKLTIKTLKQHFKFVGSGYDVNERIMTYCLVAFWSNVSLFRAIIFMFVYIQVTYVGGGGNSSELNRQRNSLLY